MFILHVSFYVCVRLLFLETAGCVETHCFLMLDTHTPHSWNGVSLQSYFDAAISIILPFADWHYKLQSSLSTGQVVTLSLLNGYITFRFYQKTLAQVAQQALKESVERKYCEGLSRIDVTEPNPNNLS
jgi:hypothetical protein